MQLSEESNRCQVPKIESRSYTSEMVEPFPLQIVITLLLVTMMMISCSARQASVTDGQADIEYDLLYSMPAQTISYNEQVKPVLEKRCVVCHGCYDAPCQLKLTSVEGILRGSNEKKVYDGARILADQPTRLFEDATSTEEWREKGFRPILNETDDNPVQNLEQSVMYNMLRLKQLHPQARTGMLPDTFDLGLDRRQSCPTSDTFEQYAREHPEGGMPFAMPNLPQEEYNTLVHWIAQGAPMPEDEPPSTEATSQIKRWESFLNGKSLREKLVSRYLYEHLFLAHLHFEGTHEREFYRLLRSRTPPGQPVEVIATRRPYDDPGSEFYYRLVRHQGSIVAKNHLVYELSAKRLQRYQSLFFEPSYEVSGLPSRDPEVASNPIKSFRDIPVKSRYRFLLDDARFFIEGFIKGPVCRGQIALNVIEDQFWVVFFDPDADIMPLDEKFLNKVSAYLASPAEQEDTFRLLRVPGYYQWLFQQYVQTKIETSSDFKPVDLDKAMQYIWRGDGNNKNAALTVFRHMDSASVNYGLIGDYPETAWVIDYSILERIHYLLVAGFDVYGNIGHQLNTRLYMDFLRTEGEDYFLSFLPPVDRQAIRDSWYQGIRRSNEDIPGEIDWLNRVFVTGYRSDKPQLELYRHLEAYLGPLAGDGDIINRCDTDKCSSTNNRTLQRVERAMQQAVKMDGVVVQFLPDVAFLRIRAGGESRNDLAYTMISNKAYRNVTSMFEAQQLGERRDYQFDTQTIVPWLEGAYPNFFYDVPLEEIETFVSHYNAIANRDDYERFVARYGVRRTSGKFWQLADWFSEEYRKQQPVLSGIHDLNRYHNR